MARLDQLGPAKGTAQLGATIGRGFLFLLQAVTHLDTDLVRHDLQQLVEAEQLYQRGVGASAVYVFKHALIQEAAYTSLLRRTRQQYHQHIAQVWRGSFPPWQRPNQKWWRIITQRLASMHSPFRTGSALGSTPLSARPFPR